MNTTNESDSIPSIPLFTLIRLDHESWKRHWRGFHTTRLAWPVWVWKVVAPNVKTTDLDPLQAAVIGLVASGVARPTEICRLLGISSELLDRVVNSQSAYAWFRQRTNANRQVEYALTPDGRARVVPSNKIEDISPTTGWVMRDALRGEVAPFFHTGLLTPAPAASRKEVQRLPHGGASTRAKPSVMSVERALRIAASGHWKEVDSSSGGLEIESTAANDWTYTTDDTAQVERPDDRINSVRFLTDAPDLMYLEMVLHVALDDPNEQRMKACNHLGPWFMHQLRLAESSGVHTELNAALTAWKQQAREKRPPQNPLQLTVETDLGVALTLPELKDVEETWALAMKAKSLNSSVSDGHDACFDLVALRLGKHLEAVLEFCINRCPTVGQPFPDRPAVSRAINAAETRLGVRIPRTFKSGGILDRANNLASYRGSSVKDRALYLLLLADSDATQPFRRVIIENPNFFTELDLVAQHRNDHSHYKAHGDNARSMLTVESLVAIARHLSSVTLRAYLKNNVTGEIQ